MKMKYVIHLFCFLGVFSMMFLVNFQRVNAAEAKTVSLKVDVTYNKYDITGDGVKDTLLVKEEGNPDYDAKDVVEVFVNDKSVLRLKAYSFYTTDITLICLENGKVFLHLNPTGDNDDGPSIIYQYRDDHLTEVANFGNLTKKMGYHNLAYIKSVKKNKIVVKNMTQSYAVAGISFECTYEYKNNGLKLTSKTYKTYDYCNYGYATERGSKSGYITANRGFKVYTSLSAKKVSFRIKKGDRVKLSKVYINGNKVLYKIKTKSGKSGWFISPKKCLDDNKKYFVQMAYAG